MDLKLVLALQKVVGFHLSDKEIETIKNDVMSRFDHDYEVLFGDKADNKSEVELDEMLTDLIKENVSKLTKLSEPIRLWRGLCGVDLEDINLKDLGTSWSYTKEGAQCYGYDFGFDSSQREQDVDYYLSIEVSKKQIHWPSTLIYNIDNPHETEVTPKEGRYVVEIYNREDDLVKEDSGYITHDNLLG